MYKIIIVDQIEIEIYNILKNGSKIEKSLASHADRQQFFIFKREN